jgi:hypothetical protein
MTKTKPKKYRTKRKKGGIGISDLFKGNTEIPDLEKKIKNSTDITASISNNKDLINNLEKQLKIYETINEKLGTDNTTYEKIKTITAINYLKIVIYIQKQNKQLAISDIDNFNKAHDIITNVIAQEKNKKILADIIGILTSMNTLTNKEFKKKILKLVNKLIEFGNIILSIQNLKNKINDISNDNNMIRAQITGEIQSDIEKLKDQINQENSKLLQNAKTEAAEASDAETTAKSILDSIVLPEESEKFSIVSAAKKFYTKTSDVISKNTGDLTTQIKNKIQSLSSKKATSSPLTDLTPDLTKDIYKMKQVSRQIDYSFTTNIEANSELLFSRLKTFIFLDIKNYITYLHNNYDNDNCKKDLNKLMFIFVAFIYLINKNNSFITLNYCFFKYLLARDNISTIVFDINQRNDLIADIISIIELMLMSDYLNLNYLYGQICINVYLYETKKNGNILSNNHIPNKIDSILHFIMRLFTNTLCYYLNNIRYYSYIETQPAYDAYKQIYTNSSSLNVNELGDFQEDRIYLNLSKNIDKKIITVLLNNLFYTKKGCRYDRLHFGGVKIEPIELANMSFDNPLYLLNHTIMDLCYLLNFYIIIQKQVFKKSLNYLTKIDTSNIQNLYDKYLEQS